MLSFQEIIARLNAFWQEHGCVIHQPYDLETGAGTFNPATFLRSLGPEPYKTAYVEPSRRPQDGRYAENPNRVQLFHQYQVIIKPSPFDIQQLYLDSLRALGLPLEKHDIRFVCDDWESPSLGAWGLGWEIWIDGMEASQFTYFQAIGSLMLKPIPVEITYGLERLAMYLQGVDSIFAVKWNDELTFGDIIKQSEIEWSHYNFEEASIEMWSRHFIDFEKETSLLLQKGLPIPAFDFVIKASHAFNILDARGTISVTERAGYIARIRNLARLVAEGYLATREQKGFPLLKEAPAAALPPLAPLPSLPKGKTYPFLLEIGSEELPPAYVKSGMESLSKNITQLLDAENISYRGIHTFGTHRRIALFIEELALEAKVALIEKKGPPLDVCFDASGHLSPQGKGFLSSLGIAPLKRSELESSSEIQVRTIKGVEYLFAMTSSKATDTAELLSSRLPDLIAGLQFPKKMIWNTLDFPYPRPIFSLVCLFGKEVLPFRIANITSGRNSFGHRQLMAKTIPLSSPEEYLSALRPHKVIACPKEREEFLRKQLAEEESKLSLKATQKDRVLREVLYLSEYPTIAAASFRSQFLSVPREVLISEMIEHQRYFPCESKDGALVNTFFITCDRAPSELIRKGNERVLSARLSDGSFLYEQDRKKSLLEWNASLEKMVFYQGLGSVYDKVKRIEKHAETLYRFLPLGSKQELLEAAQICKADLATDMVSEFPELQGTMGRYYALAEGKSETVARAIEEHWMPKGENSPLPSSPTATLLSLADKLDNLIGYFGIGCKPSSSADPLALRRQAIGIIKLLLPYSVDLGEILQACKAHFPPSIAEEPNLVPELLQFFRTRAKGVYLERGLAKEEIEACLIDETRFDPQGTLSKVEALRSLRAQTDAFEKLAEVHKRATGQLKQGVPGKLSPELCREPEEKELCALLLSWEASWETLLKKQNFLEGFEKLATLQPKIAALFEGVKILDDDTAIRANRLALLQKVCGYCDSLLDLSQLTQKQ